MKGYTGRVLFVDLTQRSWRMETIPDEVYEGYLSGVGLGAHILYQHIPRGADPLGSHNMLGFISGLLTGTSALFAGRWMVARDSSDRCAHPWLGCSSCPPVVYWLKKRISLPGSRPVPPRWESVVSLSPAKRLRQAITMPLRPMSNRFWYRSRKPAREPPFFRKKELMFIKCAALPGRWSIGMDRPVIRGG